GGAGVSTQLETRIYVILKNVSFLCIYNYYPSIIFLPSIFFHHLIITNLKMGRWLVEWHTMIHLLATSE
ncbi:hypothetical protein ACJX0J_007532, partial [Zea mays]